MSTYMYSTVCISVATKYRLISPLIGDIHGKQSIEGTVQKIKYIYTDERSQVLADLIPTALQYMYVQYNVLYVLTVRHGTEK